MDLPARWSATALFLGALLMGCAAREDAVPPAGRARVTVDAHAPISTGAAGDVWLTSVQARIAADANAIHPRDGGFTAGLPGVGLSARFDEAGVALSGDEGEALSFHTTGWGRRGDLTPVYRRTPELGECTAALDPEGRCIRRLEYADPGLTEWWIGLGTGLEQGWTVDRTPPGDGPLVMDVGVEGALVIERQGRGLTMTDEAGRVWRVGDVSAQDAHGEALPARVLTTDDGLRIEIDDAGAAYPVDIDPVYTTAAWTATGVPGNAPFALTVAGAGDVNGDGYDDVMVGSQGYYSSLERVYVYEGSPSGLSSTASTILVGAAPLDGFGASLSELGDVNGDGYDDLIVAATDAAYIYEGSSSGVSVTPATALGGESMGDDFASSVSGAGDVNGDGYDDVIVGAEGYSRSAGRAYVYLGSSSGVSPTASTVLNGETSYDYLGWSVSGAGDVNSDGYDDVIVGAIGYDAYTGRALVYLGSGLGVSGSPTTTLIGEATSACFGGSVSGAGDVNGDGYDDVIVGAYASGATGRVYVYDGAPAGLSSTASTTLMGADDEYLGISVSDAGDVNGDGYDDVVVGAQSSSDLGSGRAYVYEGSATGVSSIASTALAGEGSSNYFGFTVSGAGDVNGDGHDEVIVSSYGYDYYTGRAYV